MAAKPKLVRIFVPDKSGWTFLTLACGPGDTAAKIRDSALDRIRKKRLSQKAEQVDPVVERLLDADPDSLFLERRWEPKLKLEPLILPESTLIEPLISSADSSKFSIFLTLPPAKVVNLNSGGGGGAGGGGGGEEAQANSPVSANAQYTNFFGLQSSNSLLSPASNVKTISTSSSSSSTSSSLHSERESKGVQMLLDVGLTCTRYSADPRQPTSSVNIFYTPDEGKLGAIYWCLSSSIKERSALNQLKLDKLTDVCLGKKTAILRSEAVAAVSDDRCVSLHTKQTNLHLAARNSGERDLLVYTLKTLLSGRGQVVNLKRYDEKTPDDALNDVVNRHAEGMTSPLPSSKSFAAALAVSSSHSELTPEAWESMHDQPPMRTYQDYDDTEGGDVESSSFVVSPPAPSHTRVSSVTPSSDSRSSSVSSSIPVVSTASIPVQPLRSASTDVSATSAAGKRPLPRGVTFHRLKPSSGNLHPGNDDASGPAPRPHVYDV